MKVMSIFMFIMAAVSIMLAVWVSGMWLQFLLSAVILFLTGALFIELSEKDGPRR